MLNVDFMVRNCCRSIRSKMRVTWRRNFAGNLIALAVVTVFVVTYVKLLQYNKASSTTFNLVANRHRRPRGLHASHTEHRGSKNATSRLTVHVVEEHHQGKSLNVTHDDITFNRLISFLIRNIFIWLFERSWYFICHFIWRFPRFLHFEKKIRSN